MTMSVPLSNGMAGDDPTEESDREAIRSAFSQLYLIPSSCLEVIPRSANAYALFISLPFLYQNTSFQIKVWLEASVQDVCDQLRDRLSGQWTFGGCEYEWLDDQGGKKISSCAVEPVSGGENTQAIRLCEVIMNRRLFLPIPVGE